MRLDHCNDIRPICAGKSFSHPHIKVTQHCWLFKLSQESLPDNKQSSSEAMVKLQTFLIALAATSIGVATESPVSKRRVQCPIVLDGHVPMNFTASEFDTTASPFSPKYVHGMNLTWSQILKLPYEYPSIFDIPADKAVEVFITDQSLFLPGGGKVQVGFRRADLIMGNGSDASNFGVKTFHWSVQQDQFAKMNPTHEYMNVWHEANDYASNQFSFNTGIMLAQDQPLDSNVSTIGLDKNLWKILNRKNEVTWTTKIDWYDWQNLAVTLDYLNKTSSSRGSFTRNVRADLNAARSKFTTQRARANSRP